MNKENDKTDVGQLYVDYVTVMYNLSKQDPNLYSMEYLISYPEFAKIQKFNQEELTAYITKQVFDALVHGLNPFEIIDIACQSYDAVSKQRESSANTSEKV